MALSLKKEEKPENEKRITFVEGQIFQKITVQSEKGGGAHWNWFVLQTLQ